VQVFFLLQEHSNHPREIVVTSKAATYIVLPESDSCLSDIIHPLRAMPLKPRKSSVRERSERRGQHHGEDSEQNKDNRAWSASSECVLVLLLLIVLVLVLVLLPKLRMSWPASRRRFGTEQGERGLGSKARMSISPTSIATTTTRTTTSTTTSTKVSEQDKNNGAWVAKRE